jgi:non-homologous end joining protein Ku
VAASPVVTPQNRKRVVDLTEALNQSLANLKKPAGSEQQMRKPEESSVTKTKKRAESAG